MSGTKASAVSSGANGSGDGGGLLIGNFESGSGESGHNTPQIKLIEFGSEQSEEQQAPNLDRPSDVQEVAFDPFGGLSSTADQNANSAIGDLLGLGLDDPGKNAGHPSQSVPTASKSGGTGNLFDPFGSLNNQTSDPFKSTNGSGVSHTFNLLEESPKLMPMSNLSAPLPSFSMAHRHSVPSNLLTPSAITSEPMHSQSRKLSTPDPFQPQQPPAPADTLKTSFSSKASFSHPNLSSFGSNQQQWAFSSNKQGGLGSGMRVGMGMGMRGSASHNTSPQRSPSPNRAQSSSTGNLTQEEQPSRVKFDPFGQFNLKEISGGAKAGSRPGSSGFTSTSTTQHSKPPTGNSYQPYYMQNQANSRSNGLQQSGSQSQINPTRTGMGAKPTAASAFQARPQSPNYNPPLFSTAGNKTGWLISMLTVCLEMTPEYNNYYYRRYGVMSLFQRLPYYI